MFINILLCMVFNRQFPDMKFLIRNAYPLKVVMKITPLGCLTLTSRLISTKLD